MLDELKPIFEQIDKNIFNEDTLKQVSAIIEAKVNEKTEARVTLAVEAATKTLDEDMTEKMKHLVETIKRNIDKDHLTKIKYVVEQLNTDHLGKLVTLKENYDTLLKKTAQEHKMQLVESVDTFLEKYIDKNLPKQQRTIMLLICLMKHVRFLALMKNLSRPILRKHLLTVRNKSTVLHKKMQN